MAFVSSLTCTFQTQGPSIADNTKPNSPIKDQVEIQSWSFGVKSPFDVATGHMSGKRQHSPLTITKVQGPFDVMAWKAAATQETISSLVLTAWRTTSTPAQPATSTPAQPATSTPAQPAKTSAPAQPAKTSKPAQPAAAVAEVPYWTVTLTNAQVVELTTNTVPAGGYRTREITTIQFTFQKIEINAVQDKKSASDDWTTSV